MVYFDEVLDAVVVCEIVDKFVAEVHIIIGHWCLMPAHQTPSIKSFVRQHGPSDRCEPYRVQPKLLWEVVKQVGETVLLEHACIASVSAGCIAVGPLDGEVLSVKRFGFVFCCTTLYNIIHQPDRR